MVLMIDNYDSFTYNLVQYLGELDEEVVVYRNDEITLDEVERLAPAHVVISRSVHAERGGYLRPADPTLRRPDPDPGRLPGSSE